MQRTPWHWRSFNDNIDDMKRSDFLKVFGGAVTLPVALPFIGRAGAPAKGASGAARSNCILVPSETAGPFPLDLSENDYFFRQDITEDVPGVRLRQRIRIIGAGNCEPMPNVRVNVWHCDRDGNYSGYGTLDGQTHCRGYQFTDANGECEFVTIVPGWYPGRVTHMHFQVFVSTQYSVVSQYTWPHDAVVEAVEANADLYPDGPDPLTPEQDGAFSSGYELQLADLVWDAAAGEYVSFYEATVEGDGTSGVGYQEMRTAEVMALGQNFPNPAVDHTTIPLTLHRAAEVTWSLWSVQGQCVYRKKEGVLSAGDHRFEVEFQHLGLAPASYVYQLEMLVDGQRYTSVRRMTVR